MIAMELDNESLDDQTRIRIKGLTQALDLNAEEVIREAVKNFAKEKGDELVQMQGQQKLQQEKIAETQETEAKNTEESNEEQ